MKKLAAIFLVALNLPNPTLAEPSRKQIESEILFELRYSFGLNVSSDKLSGIDYIVFEDERTGTGRVSAKVYVELAKDLYTHTAINWDGIAKERVSENSRNTFLDAISERLGETTMLRYEVVSPALGKTPTDPVIAEIAYVERITGPAMDTELEAPWLNGVHRLRELNGVYELTPSELEDIIEEALSKVSAEARIGTINFATVEDGAVDPGTAYLVRPGDDKTLSLGPKGITLQRVFDECINISVKSGPMPEQQPAGPDGSYSKIRIIPSPENPEPIRIIVKESC